ncbi:MAG: hypothetical protein ACLTL0_05575 [Bifidobacterium longum]
MTRSHRNEDRGGEHRWTSNGSNPATFTADGLYLPGFRPNSLIGFGVRLMGMVVFVSFNVHAKSVDFNIFSVFTKVFE